MNTAIIWWEKRRPWFNLILLGTRIVTIELIELAANYVLPAAEDAEEPTGLVIGIIVYGLAANIFYTLGWVSEIRWSDGDTSRTAALRPRVFRLGLYFSIGLTQLPLIALPLLWLGLSSP